MPRLLLVDDNQSIHKIAETLLAATDIELTCASSGAEALELAASAGPFDAALLDTTMMGMDGWELLDRFRHNVPTALMPIAMMAGVLDVVDPETVRKAPIQGFLKKPVELRDLADRVRALASTLVAAPEPELQPLQEPEAPDHGAASYATMPYIKLSDHRVFGGDMLLLEPGDVLVEEAEPSAQAVPTALELEGTAWEEPAAEEPRPSLELGETAFEDTATEEAPPSLELEELDLESLKVLPPPEAPAAGPVPEELITAEELEDLPDFSVEDSIQAGALDLNVVTDELPDLGPAEEPAAPEAAKAQAEPAMPLPEDWADESESLLELSGETSWAVRPPEAPILAEHTDFGPDSFLDAEPGPEPTPAFLPEIPENVQPVQFTELAPEDEIVLADELEPLPELDDITLKSTFDVNAAPGVDTLHLDAPPTHAWEEEAFEEIAELPAEEPPQTFVPEPLEVPAAELLEVPAEEPLEAPAAELLEAPAAELLEAPAAEPLEAPAAELLEAPAAELLEAPAAEPLEAPAQPLETSVPEPPAPAPAPAHAGGADPLAAILADPVLMDRLAKAVVARLGDQVLREIAWEVMPELAGRLQRN